MQYIADWPAGWGVKETVDFIRQQSAHQKVYLATQGTFGLTPFGFEMYFWNDPNVTVKGYWPIETTVPQDLLEKAKQMPTYIYFYEPCVECPMSGVAPSSWPITPLMTVTKDDTKVHATLYQVETH